MKTTVAEMKNALDSLIIKWDMVKERTSELEDKAIGTSHTGRKKKSENNRLEHPRTIGDF